MSKKILIGIVLSFVSFCCLYADVRTVCGTNDMEKMINLDEKMNAMGRPIGNLRAGGMSCTGTLIAKDLFLTARHCKSSCSNIKVTFGYLTREKETFPCKEIVESGGGSSNQDFLVIRLQGDPGAVWGYYDMSNRPLTQGQNLLMIHHPSGSPMKVSRKNCTFKRENNGLFYHGCDTEPGSSGSAILIPDYDKPENSRIVAVHAMGGCNSSSTSFNSGPSIKFISSISNLIRSMLKD